jgi:3-hydroxyisobutyrate dehydrogenase
MTAYGFIGLGHLGGHLAASLLKAGFRVTVHDRDEERGRRLVSLGGEWAETPKLAAERSDAVKAVLTGPEGILAGLRRGGTWIETSTLGRDEVLRLAGIAALHGIDTLEAPVTGGVHRAAEGDITVLVGGPAELFQAHRPAVEAMGGEIFHIGPLGSAAVIKVITNMLAFIHLVATGEALMLAKRGGLDLEQVWHAIRASSGNSFVHETEGQLILNGSYDIGFTMDLAVKDLGFAMELGREFRSPLDVAGTTAQTFIRAREAYGGDAWSTEVVRLLEDALKTDLRAPGVPATLSG